MKHWEWLMSLILMLCVGLVGFIVSYLIARHAFNVTHHCVPTDQVRPRWAGPILQDDILWHCDNGDVWE
jgi:hypothetical protein